MTSTKPRRPPRSAWCSSTSPTTAARSRNSACRPTRADMSLFDRHVEFVTALRTAGLTISIAEGLDAAQAVQVVPLIDREQLRHVYAATLVKRQLQRPVFDTVFDLYFPAVMGRSVAGEGAD